MDRPDILTLGMTLTEGQFITSIGDGIGYFAGIVDHQFGVYAGTPQAPLGTSITLSYPCAKVAMLADGSLAGYADASDTTPSWSTPASGAPCFAVMQADGNLCVYAGKHPDEQGAFVFGSLQSGGLTSGFLPYPEYQTSTVTVTGYTFITPFKWSIMAPDGTQGTATIGYNDDTTASITGKAGGSCYLRAQPYDDSHTQDSGDNFAIGDQGVHYTCIKDHDPFTSTYCAWDRVS